MFETESLLACYSALTLYSPTIGLTIYSENYWPRETTITRWTRDMLSCFRYYTNTTAITDTKHSPVSRYMNRSLYLNEAVY